MPDFPLRPAVAADLPELLDIETLCFDTDRLSRRSFSRWFDSPHAIFQVMEDPAGEGRLAGYVLVLLQRGTRLARLYSVAVRPPLRRRGHGRRMLEHAEHLAAEEGRLAMRLEVGRDNTAAIGLYESQGYRSFEVVADYYDDHTDALRMQKRIRFPADEALHGPAPWFMQTTPFSCGPAALLMAMGALEPGRRLAQEEELDIWREATTIFMTSGHGGCHPYGLALAARRRGFAVDVWLRQTGPLFLDGVRSADKKHILKVVHRQFRDRMADAGIPVVKRDITLADIQENLDLGHCVLLLISTYRFNGRKSPHWVLVTGMDPHCLYVHDPDPEEGQRPIDCQHVPIARSDFDSMISYGSSRLKTALVLKKP